MKRICIPLAILIILSVPVFAQQPDLSLVPYRKGDLWGYTNPDKSIIIKPSFNEANWFFEGYAVVKKGTKYGYINKAGKVVIPFKFYSAKPFTWGYFDSNGKHTAGGKTVKNKDTVLFAGAALNASGNEVCIDTKGLTMSRCPAINEASVNTPPAISVDSTKIYSLTNNGGVYDKLVDDYKIAGDEHTYYIGIKNNKYGVMNNTFDIVVPFENDSIKKSDVNGMYYLQVQKNGMYGVYNGNGSVFIPVEKTAISFIQPGDNSNYFIEAKDGLAHLRDMNNKEVITGNYSDIMYDRRRGFILTANDNTKGYYFLDTKLIAPKYAAIRSVRGGNYLWVQLANGKSGYVNNDGVEFFEE
jgi:hypothetical protein